MFKIKRLLLTATVLTLGYTTTACQTNNLSQKEVVQITASSLSLETVARTEDSQVPKFLDQVLQPNNAFQADALRELQILAANNPEVITQQDRFHVSLRDNSELVTANPKLERTYTFQDNNLFSVTYFDRSLNADALNPALTLVYQTPDAYRQDPRQIQEAFLVAAAFLKTDPNLRSHTAFGRLRDDRNDVLTIPTYSLLYQSSENTELGLSIGLPYVYQSLNVDSSAASDTQNEAQPWEYLKVKVEEAQ